MATLLIVDDNELSRDSLESALDDLGHTLLFAIDGAQALELAAARLPDLILLDVMMPDLDGFEVCRRLRADPRLAEVPIILLTALDDRLSRLKGFQAGADEFLSKPIDRTELRARVNTIARLNRYRLLWTERARLDDSYRELQQLSRRLVQVQEAERRALAGELHDEIGQMLTGTKLLLESGLLGSEADLREKVHEALALTRDTLGRVREISVELRPAMLDDVGLFAALGWLCDRVARQTGLVLRQRFDRLATRRFPPELEIAAFRIVQEALTNVARHASAGAAEVQASIETGRLVVCVQDSGAGFDLGAVRQADAPSSGLTGMRERAMSVNGDLTIETAPGAGTRVRASFPLSETRNHA